MRNDALETSSTHDLKKAFRKKALATRRAIETEKKIKLDRIISDKLIAYFTDKSFEKVFAYMPLPDEIDIRPFLDRVLNKGHELYLPKVFGSDMRFFRVDEIDRLETGRYGIKEPPETAPEGTPSEKDLVILPGCAFDRRGGRMGYGGGYYDRYFSVCDKAALIAAAYSMTVYDDVPCDDNDIMYDVLITEDDNFDVITEGS